jgi:cytochrome c-type biogenesis protein CcmH
MSGFVAIAGLLTLLVLIALLYPLLRRREGSPEAWRSAGVAGVLILVGAAALYPVWSDFKWHEPEPAADSPQAMVGRLARRLEKNPDDLDGWLMLGRSYGVIGRADPSLSSYYELAARAYQRANTLAEGRNFEALMGLAQTLVLSGRSDLDGQAGRLFEQAMQLEGATVEALVIGALVAKARNELPLAKERFQQVLVRANAPPNVAEMIQRQIDEIDALSAMAAGAPGTAESSGAAVPAVQGKTVSIALRITLSPAVAGKAAAGAPLFVVARVPGQRQPVAVRRIDAKFPLEVDLLSSDGMGGGNAAFTAGQELDVEARVANTGGAISRSGDPFGAVRIKAGSGQRTAIEINQLRP